MIDMSPHVAAGTLASLERRIETLNEKALQLRRVASSTRRRIYASRIVILAYLLRTALRAPSRQYNLWPIGMLLVCPLAVGLLIFIIWYSITSSPLYSTIAAFIAGALCAGLLAKEFYKTDDQMLAARIDAARKRLNESRIAYERVQLEHSEFSRLLADAASRRRAIQSAIGAERLRLLQQDWRSLRGADWEYFLSEVFHMLGAKVQRTGRSGDHGVDLVVEIGTRRYAVQAKGYQSNVDNAAVQEAVAGQVMYNCNCCAVITNSGFTAGAIALARMNCCLLIGGDEIPSLILGQVSL